MTTENRTVRRLAILNFVLMTGFPALIVGSVLGIHGLVIAGGVLVALLAVDMIVIAPVTLARSRRSVR